MALLAKRYYIVGIFSTDTTNQQFINARNAAIAELQSLGIPLANINTRGPFDWFRVNAAGDGGQDFKVAVVEVVPP